MKKNNYSYSMLLIKKHEKEKDILISYLYLFFSMGMFYPYNIIKLKT